MHKNYSIQILKAICALIVFFSHSLNFPNIPAVQKLMNTPFHFFFDGQIAVIIFIVISGFFYQKELKLSFSNYWGGVGKKIIRIYTPYIIIITFGAFSCNAFYSIEYNSSHFTEWATSFWINSVSFSEYLAHIAVVLPHDTHLIDPPSWYVPVEVRLFLVVPIVVMIANTTKRCSWLLYIPMFVLMVLGKSIYIGACLLGCCGRLFYNRYFQKVEKSEYKNAYKLCFLLVSMLLLNINNEINLDSNIAFTMQVLGASILVPIVYSFNVTKHSNNIFVWLGNLSYEFFLVHFIILLALRPLYHDSVTYIIFSLALSILASILVNRLCNYIITRLNQLKSHGRTFSIRN